jgi:alpha-D-ribose 1-methylphosphonate 5-triphosphate diphosphatase
LLAAIERLRPQLRCNSYIHIRHELVNTDDHDELKGWMTDHRIDLLSLNDHLPPMNNEGKMKRYLAGLARRVAMTDGESQDFIQALQGRRQAGETQVRELCDLAHACEIPLASHDDACQQDVERSRQRRVAIAEFPMSLALASTLREQHIAVVLGAPNLVRGGSHVGGLSVDEALRNDQVDVICSDYHYPSLFHAPFLMASQGLRPLAAGWKLVSEHPASTVGLGDRKGRLAEGYDADMLMLDTLDGCPLSINAVFTRGRQVLQRDERAVDAIPYQYAVSL